MGSKELEHDELKILYKYNKKNTLPGLIKLIYKYFENFEILIPYLQDIDKYTQKSIYDRDERDFPMCDRECEHEILYRAFPFTLGTYILLKKYHGIFSQLFTFLYFYVKYMIDNKIKLDIFDYKVTDHMYTYLSKFVIIEKEGIMTQDLTDNKYANTIYGHTQTGISSMPHFFISFTDNLETANLYDQRNIDILSRIDIKNEMSAYPVLIYINQDDHIKAYHNKKGNEYIFPPYIANTNLHFKQRGIYNGDGTFETFEYPNPEQDFQYLGGYTKIKKINKKVILGKERCIYKKTGDREEYLKYKGELITVKDYKKIKAKPCV